MIRRGSTLIVVAGIAALMTALVLGLLARARTDVEDMAAFVDRARARAMLAAALTYIQETSRLGWSDPAATAASEAYGWIDARDDSPGPKDRLLRPLAAFDPVTGLGPAFPAVGGAAARCPTRLLARPPSAIEPILVPNPLPAEPSGDWRADIAYTHDDPTPALDPAWPVADRFARWRAGDRRPLPGTDLGWFRVYRATPADCAAHRDLAGNPAPLHWSPAVFFIACGSGASQGFRSWDEVVAAGMTAVFADDEAVFAALRAREAVLHFACEWTPMQGSFGHKFLHQDASLPDGSWATCAVRFAQSATNRPWKDDSSHRPASRDFGGSFLWIERLPGPPAIW